MHAGFFVCEGARRGQMEMMFLSHSGDVIRFAEVGAKRVTHTCS